MPLPKLEICRCHILRKTFNKLGKQTKENVKLRVKELVSSEREISDRKLEHRKELDQVARER